MLFVTSFSILLACVTSEHVMFVVIAVLITNLLGAIVGMVVTHGFGLPNDGSPPPGCNDDAAASDRPERFD